MSWVNRCWGQTDVRIWTWQPASWFLWFCVFCMRETLVHTKEEWKRILQCDSCAKICNVQSQVHVKQQMVTLLFFGIGKLCVPCAEIFSLLPHCWCQLHNFNQLPKCPTPNLVPTNQWFWSEIYLRRNNHKEKTWHRSGMFSWHLGSAGRLCLLFCQSEAFGCNFGWVSVLNHCFVLYVLVVSETLGGALCIQQVGKCLFTPVTSRSLRFFSLLDVKIGKQVQTVPMATRFVWKGSECWANWSERM